MNLELEARYSQVIGRVLIKRILTSIVRPDETKNTTKFILIDAVGPGAEANGLRVGQVVIPILMTGISLDGGVSYRPILEDKDIRIFVRNANLADFEVQTDNGTRYVPFSDPEAAAPFVGARAQPVGPKSEAA